MNTTLSRLRRTGLVCAGAALALPTLGAAGADTPTNADAFPNYESYIKVSGEAPFITGDAAAFASHTGTPSNGAYGIEDLFFTKDVTKFTTINISGRALEGSDDYLAKLDVTTNDFGSIDVGYKRFRTFYDGVGGFFPLADRFQAMSQQSLHVDRSTFWFDAKLAKPDGPAFSISFHDEIRTGQKDSSEWGAIINPDADVAKGALVGTAAPTNTPYINPNVLTMAEHHNILEGAVTDTVGKTTDTFKATFDWVNNDDARNYVRYPNSIVTADPMVNVLDDRETTSTNTFRVLNQTETKFNEHFALETGFTYFHLTGEDGGEWITPAYNATAKAIFNAVTAGNVVADPKSDDFVGNIGLKFTPTKDWIADIGFRDEYNVISDAGGFETTSLAAGSTSTASTNVTTAQDVTYSHETDHVESPEVSIQYLGISRLSLYASFDDRINDGNQHWINPYAAVTTTGKGVVTTVPVPVGNVYFQGADQDNKDAKIGANWNACTQLTVRAEIFRKDHQNRFIGSNDYVGTASYGALFATGYTFTGAKLTVIYKPVPELSFSTRYQQQDGRMAVTANVFNGGLGTEIPSGKATIEMVSETVDWTPYRQVYFQGNVNVVYNCIQTAYPFVVVTTSSPAVPVPFQNSNNNYTTSSALCGFVFDKETDVQLEGFWERADNYNPQVALGGQPFGAGFELESLTMGIKHKFTDHLMGDMKLGYMKSTDATTGGFTNYDGPLAYISLTFAL